jgi:NADPH:quinone reductase
MMRAIQVSQRGGPEVFEVADASVPDVGPKQVRLRMVASALNYSDIQIAGAFYPGMTDDGKLPYIAGREGAGIVDAVGENVTNVAVGDRVMAVGIVGAFAEYAICPAQVVRSVPDDVTLTAASGFLLSHLAAVAALEIVAELQTGQTLLVHAGASSVGQNVIRFAKRIGATVIATASNEEKLHAAQMCGADHLIDYVAGDFAPQVMELTDGVGVDVAFDTVGGEVLKKTLGCMRPFGRLVVAGNASNAAVTVTHYELLQKYRCSLMTLELGTMMVKRRDLIAQVYSRMAALIDEGVFSFEEPICFPLEEAPNTLQMMAERKLVGSACLCP